MIEFQNVSMAYKDRPVLNHVDLTIQDSEFFVLIGSSGCGKTTLLKSINKLLCLLARNTGKVLTHNFILNEIWGSSAFSDTPSLRVFMATLRKKLEVDPSHPQYIQTHIGVGYRMIRQKQEDEA